MYTLSQMKSTHFTDIRGLIRTWNMLPKLEFNTSGSQGWGEDVNRRMQLRAIKRLGYKPTPIPLYAHLLQTAVQTNCSIYKLQYCTSLNDSFSLICLAALKHSSDTCELN